ncbi:MAG: putative quinol monooxygenase [Sphingomonas sp.]|uniref:putative quinol monooxygenase n=1 Tax=Sphingomonas sp. TaxID=28214 RepID=UPI002274991C|nr:putative quinol monooxygenase [Sphingomonas sp.]MCX8478011.1 putative quinol monooxygenase [Sphingomonas sp.]
MRFPRILMLPALLAGTPAAMAQATAEQPASGIAYAAIPEGAWSVVAQVRARPGKEDALREATLPLVALVRSDPKNLVYFLQEDRDRPGHFIFYEIFATRADFEAHNAMPYVRQWFARLPELAEGGVTVMQMDVLGHR